MVLFQVSLVGYNNGRIGNRVPCPFVGRYRVKLLNVHCFTADPTSRIYRLDSPQFDEDVSSVSGNSSFGAKVFFNNYSGQGYALTLDRYIFNATMNGYLEFDIVGATSPGTPPGGDVPPGFDAGKFYMSLDFEKI